MNLFQGMDSGNKVQLNDEILKTLLKTSEMMDWNTLFQKVTAAMTKTYIITGADGRQSVRKLDLPKISFKVLVQKSVLIIWICLASYSKTLSKSRRMCVCLRGCTVFLLGIYLALLGSLSYLLGIC